MTKKEEYGTTTGRKRKVNYLNLDKCCRDKCLQKVRRRLCNKFARTSLNPYKDFKKFIQYDKKENC